VVLFVAPCFEAQGGTPVVDVDTYLYYMQLKPSQPSQNVWVTYDEGTEKVIHDDFVRLWGTNFLDNLSITSDDYNFPNGVVGKLITYNMEERQRVKIVDYVGSKKIEATKIDEKLKELNAVIRLDTFIDPALVKKVQGIVRQMLQEKGFEYAEVMPEIKPMEGGPKLVHLTFHMEEGPKVKIKSIDFIGNHAFSDGALKKHMKENKEVWWLSFISGRGTYNETKYDEDAEKVTDFYRDHGYVRANVGAPDLKFLGDSDDKKTRWVQLQIPVTEGPRYKVGTFDISGNTVVKSEFLKPMFELKPGDYYSQKAVRKGLQKAQEVYGSGGYMEFTGFPDFKYSDEPNSPEGQAPQAIAALADPTKPPTVDVIMRLQEGTQFFVNRITFVGNTTTHDNVIRRQMRLVEGAQFNTEALKSSIKLLNQLGYFKPLEGNKPGDVDVQKTPNETNKVDVKLKLEEQNRNQLTFGAGVSQYEGFFGQLAFQTSNFMGRGESFTVSVQAGSLAQNYTVGFTEPFLFERNQTAGVQVFRQDIRYVSQFTQKTDGFTLTYGYPLGNFTRMFVNYSYERVQVTEISDLYKDTAILRRNPFLADSLLVGQGGYRTISKITPSYVHNTVDNPIFPTSGVRYTLSTDLAGLGGNTNFYKPNVEGVWWWRQNARFSLGGRANVQFINQFTGTDLNCVGQTGSKCLPIFEKLFLGGEYTVRGFDIRSIGPSDPYTGLVLGGNKYLLFNLEQIFTIAPQVRLVAFYDAGQVRDVGQHFSWWEDKTLVVNPPPPLLVDPYANLGLLTDPNAPQSHVVVVGQQSAFKTSTGLEVRFFMPVLNVPFRLIFAYNPQRAGVLDNSLQPQKAFQFRFAVGSTF